MQNYELGIHHAVAVGDLLDGEAASRSAGVLSAVAVQDALGGPVVQIIRSGA